MDYKDRSIHLFLSSITDFYEKSRHNESRYYQKGSLRIRFSDHYSEHGEVGIEIVKLSNGCYYFSDKILHVTSCYYREDILSSIKNYFSIRPLFENTIRGLINTLTNTNKALQSANSKLKNAKLRSDLEVADAIYEENKKLKKEIKKMHETVKSTKDTCRNRLQSNQNALERLSKIALNASNMAESLLKNL